MLADLPRLPLPLARLSAPDAHAAYDLTIAVSTGLALVCVAGLLLREVREAPDERPRPRPLLPLFGLLGVCALLFINQVLFNAHVVAAHRGDPSFVARYVGPGWFVLAPDAAPVRFLLGALPGPVLRDTLAFTVLRVNAVLELPFVLFAYLAVVALLDGGVYRRLLRSPIVPLAALSFTVTFCIIEMRLWNPWTRDDLRLRLLGCVASILLFGALALRERERPAALTPLPGGIAGVARFVLGGLALCALVLGMYDVTLLYNLGHMDRVGPGLAALALCALAATLGAPRVSRPPAAPDLPAGLAVRCVLAVFCAAFFVPSLAIRYAGTRQSAALAALLIGAFSLLLGTALGMHRLRRAGWPPALALPGVLAFLLAGGACAGALLPLLPLHARLGPLPGLPLEAVLLLGAALFVGPGLLLAWAVDRVLLGQYQPSTPKST